MDETGQIEWTEEKSGFKGRGKPRIQLKARIQGTLLSVTVGDIPGYSEASVKIYVNGMVVMTAPEWEEVQQKIRAALQEVGAA